ncbi:hypothetical protein BUZ08_00850 [Staphylococcus gallinarum]|uniref:hypothetical protein n=1 Tax=Staphylococcus gallinarum TaxID=1293 RepID=UPI000D1F37AB|nr:hypothetical protein [Staphylococcus gallinarum]PTL18491.1 hypothetical protein BUZ08_00850 [Staphylococcus gallinarum]RIO80052.1 hypothetical protein BUZ07_03960 [Staphylococcus gallinarum]RIO86310.1 hypothetical protein BUZ06_13380 [Staphylococcus gallinarum]
MKYTCVKTARTPSKVFFPGDFVEIKRLKHPAVFKDNTYYYKELTTEILMSKSFIKEHFKIGQHKSDSLTLLAGIGFILGLGTQLFF